MTRLSPTVGFNLVGYVSGNLGLGVAARHIASLILSKEFPLAVFDLSGAGRGGHDRTFDQYAVSVPDALPYAITLFVLPPQTISHLSREHPGCRRLFIRREGMTAAVLMWEHSQVPRAWRPALGMLDVIVAVSHFIRSACDTTLDGVLTIPAEFPLRLPDIVPSRERFQLPSDRTIFVTSFEAYGSDRKNPLAAVEAFRRAFPDDRRAILVIKMNNTSADGALHPVVLRLRTECTQDPRFRLIENVLSYRDVLTLYASCDVFVSLHRSEGLGLALMEAMALGKPVIATAWSGNMTYMTANNSCPVAYRLVPVRTTLDVYAERVLGKHALWAEPDIGDAAAWMARLVEDGSLRSRIGAHAAESIALREHEAERGTFLDELATIHEHFTFLPSFRSKRIRLFERERQLPRDDRRRVVRSYVERVLRGHILQRIRGWSKQR